jgi:lipoprotein-anchoring transpeptidase ErfK/SrfK
MITHRYGRARRGGLSTVRVATAAGTAALVVVAGACRAGTTGADTVAKPLVGGQAVVAAPLTLAVTPVATRTSRMPVSTEIGTTVSGGRVTSVRLTRTDGGTVLGGRMRDDGSSWVPAAPLAYATAYTASVTATSADGTRTLTRTTSFTTMGQPTLLAGSGLYLFTGNTYGVAMPVVAEFFPPVPIALRASVQRRLFVASTPSQPGVWSWISGSQAYYRPPVYWQPGTTLSVRLGLGGLPMGNGYYGQQDRSATVHIGTSMRMIVDNASKTMRVYLDEKLARTIPVALGKPSTPSSSGELVVMDRAYSTIFDTTHEGPGGYRVNINYAERLTWGGEFIHAAPWSVADQGHRNVSHGCVNMSYDNAQWLFDRIKIGDPVTVRGTEVKVTPGNGWTAWNQTWGDYIKGSALPVPPALRDPPWTFHPMPPLPVAPSGW